MVANFMTTKVVMNDYFFFLLSDKILVSKGDERMSDLRKNIHRYMDIKQIKYYSDLLVMIGKELKVKDPYAFAEKEKSNFSKMLKEERPLKHEFIIPLEKIFGVSMARLMDDGAYKLPLNKEDMPYVKGFRYYAYKDDPTLYEDEFEKTMITNDGYPTICNSDEFNKTFLDYVIEYRSINALKFLLKKHDFKSFPYSGTSYQIDGKYSLFTTMENELYKMAILEDDPELFDAVYNPYIICIAYRTPFESLKIDLQTFEFILNSKKIFDWLFIPKKLGYKDFNIGVVGHDEDTIDLLNPFLTQCLDYALNDLDKYREQARRILQFGISYNGQLLERLNLDRSHLFVGEYGNMYYGGRELVGNIIFPELNTQDEEMVELIKQLPIVNHVKRA